MPKAKSKKPQRRNWRIGFLINEFDGRYPARLMPLAMRYAAENGVNLFIFPGGALQSPLEYENHQNTIYDFVNRNNLDAIVMATGTMANFVEESVFNNYIRRFRELPIISISIRLEGATNILVDGRVGIMEIMDHLIAAHGFRRIAFIKGAATNPEAQERYQAYLDSLKNHQIPFDPELVVQGNFTPLSGNTAIAELLKRRKVKFEAVLAANDEMALGALDELSVHGIRVPQDVAVAGFDNIEGAEFNPTPLTTVEQPISEQGRRAIEVALDILNGKKVPNSIYLPTRMIVRSSCGCFSKSGEAGLTESEGSRMTRKKSKSLSKAQRTKIATGIVQNIGDSYNEPRAIQKWAEDLLDVLASGVLTETVYQRFLKKVGDILNSQLVKGRNIKIWQEIIPLFKSAIAPNYTDQKSILLLTQLFQNVRELVEDTIKKEQRLYEVEFNVAYSIVNEVMQRVISNLTIEDMKKTIVSQFPRIGINSCYVCLYVGDHLPKLNEKWVTPQFSELLLAFTNGREIRIPSRQKVFPTLHMLPPHCLPVGRRYTLVVKPLYFVQEHIGFVMFEVPERHGIPNQSYETMRIQLSSAIKSSFLFSMSKRAENQLKEANKKLTATNEKLQELDRAKTNFFANISHETRSPLTLILSPLESIVAGQYGPTLDIQDEKLQVMLENGLRLLKLINNLLDFSKIEAGRMAVKYRRTNISNILNYYVNTIRPAADSRKLTVQFVDNTPGVTAWIDRDLMEKAIFNLLSNALKFTPEGQNVAVQLDVMNKNFSITVRDTGIGIPADKLKNIFERFGQLDTAASRKYDGTGIGLAFTREIVQLHQGTISVRSKPGQGSAFTVTLPVGDPSLENASETVEDVEDYREVKPSLLSGLAARKSAGDTAKPVVLDPDRKTVLVVDDNPDMRKFMASLLEKEYNVIPAENGRQALDKARREKPDIILTDVMMPEMDGYELTRIIKTSEDLKSTPVILVTAKADISMKLEGLGYGADDYLAKPFNSKELFVRVQNLLKARSLQTELVKKQKEIDADIQQASLVQKVILTPESALARIPELEVDIGYLPMNGKISGDYYNISPLRSGIASFLVADAAGHGIQAALSTMQIDLLVKESVEVPQPHSRISYINRTLTEKISSKNFFTVFLAHLYHDKIAFSSAAHPAQYLIRAGSGEVLPLKTRGKVVGMLTDCNYEMREVPIGKGDTLFLFTDGIIEEFSADGTEFGEERLLDFLRTEGRDLAPAELNAQILKRVQEYTSRKALNDDITLICARVK